MVNLLVLDVLGSERIKSKTRDKDRQFIFQLSHQCFPMYHFFFLECLNFSHPYSPLRLKVARGYFKP